jgi:hypothetical protein
MAMKTRDFRFVVGGARYGICRGNGGSQLVPPDLDQGVGPFVAPGPKSSLHDPSLSALAAQMNEIIRNVLPSRPDPRAQIGFALAGDMGIMLVWDVTPTDDDWRDEYAAGEGMERMEGKSDNELAEMFDLPRGKEA